MASDKITQRKARHSTEDLMYMRSLTAAVLQRTPRHLMLILGVMGLLVAAAITWMNLAKIDVVVRGSGKVTPVQQLQVVQSLEGGVVSEILTHEGDIVGVGQPLIKISDVAFSSSFEENQLKYLKLRTDMLRLQAEADGSEFKSDAQILSEAPDLMRATRRLYVSRQKQLQQTMQIQHEQVRQMESQLIEAQAKHRQLQRSLSLLREEIALKAPLVKKGLVGQVEFLQLKQRENDLQGEVESVGLSVPRIRSTIKEGKRKIQQSQLDFRSEARKNLNDAAAEASRIAETQQALKDRVQRTVVRSPVKGTITRLHINTVGGVIAAGGPILEIVPYGGKLIVEVRIKPADIANISTGMLARLKFSAYDFAIYGSLDGKVSFVSADTVTDKNGESYYVVRVEPERDYLGPKAQPLSVRVGMTVEADIISNKKTILEYLLKPIKRGLGKALREE